MSINNIRTKLTCLSEALDYSAHKGWCTQMTESAIEDAMDWVSIYKYLCDLRDYENTFSTTDEKVDYLYTLSTLHTKLVDAVKSAYQAYVDFYTGGTDLPKLPSGKYEPEAYKEYELSYKTEVDALLFKIGNLYNRIKIVRKILIDKGYDAPSLPKETLYKIKSIFQQYPPSFVDLD